MWRKLKMKFQDLLDTEKDCIKIIYNFTYRLSYNRKLAEKLTKRTIINYLQQKVMFPSPQAKPILIMLKEAWHIFEREYGFTNHDSSNSIENAILQLKPEIRCTIVLRDIQGFTIEEIALVLSKNIFEVNSLIATGRNYLSRYTYPSMKRTRDKC